MEEQVLLSLGEIYVSDFVPKDYDYNKAQKHELSLILDDDCGAVKLSKSIAPEYMYGRYFYRSGINSSMRKALKEIVDEIVDRVKLTEGDVWCDCASNDGTLLSFVDPKLTRIGIDPCDSTYFLEASRHGKIIQDYFSAQSYYRATSKKAKIFTCISMFYDLEDPNKFLQDVYEILDDNGVAVFQMSYTPLMLKQLAFDNILSEHVYYYDLHSITKLLTKNGFLVRDCSLNDVNGGSFRVTATKFNCSPEIFTTAPNRDVCNYRLASILSMELQPENNIVDPKNWELFYKDISDLKDRTVKLISELKASGKRIMGYGGSTKGNTLLQWYGLDSSHLEAIVEASPYKYSLYTIGSHIPIISEDEMRASPPDYLLILPWHFVQNFREKESDFLKNGGKFIVPLPQLEIV